MARKRKREASKGVGKARIGGEFTLVDQDGKTFTSEDMKGKFALVSTGTSATQRRKDAETSRSTLASRTVQTSVLMN